MNRCIVVLDIGKTFSKLSLWDADGVRAAQESHPNTSADSRAFQSIEVDAIEAWIVDTLADFAKRGSVDAIIPIAHGAAGAVIRGNALACPLFDYESPVPDEVRAAYDEQRDAFALTGSPGQSLGLNLGVQLHWLEQLYPAAFEPGSQILTYPQYWAWRLSGVASTEVTSLACHTDLWFPEQRRPSDLAVQRGWSTLFAPLHPAGDIAGLIRPELAEHTGLSPETEIYCGIHDSNASLLGARGFQELRGREFTTLATGTWFVSMRSPGADAGFEIGQLPVGKDCLINCDIDGNMVPTSLFMGGREIATLLGDHYEGLDEADSQSEMLDAVEHVVASGNRILPTFTPGVGPYPEREGHWENKTDDPVEQKVAACLYAALMANASLGLLGATERVLIDGRFSRAEVFVRALATIRPDLEVYVSDIDLEAAHGALELTRYQRRETGSLQEITPLDVSMEAYVKEWQRAAD